MATSSGLNLYFSGIKSLSIGSCHTKMPFRSHNRDTYRFSKCPYSLTLFSEMIPNHQFQYFHRRCSRTTRVLSSGRNYQPEYDNHARTEPFWLNFIRGAIRTGGNLFRFLVEQPIQLKYIEWPSFQSTLKTATLTLVLVSVLIVALSSVDSALSFLLAFFSHRKA